MLTFNTFCHFSVPNPHSHQMVPCMIWIAKAIWEAGQAMEVTISPFLDSSSLLPMGCEWRAIISTAVSHGDSVHLPHLGKTIYAIPEKKRNKWGQFTVDKNQSSMPRPIEWYFTAPTKGMEKAFKSTQLALKGDELNQIAINEHKKRDTNRQQMSRLR